MATALCLHATLFPHPFSTFHYRSDKGFLFLSALFVLFFQLSASQYYPTSLRKELPLIALTHSFSQKFRRFQTDNPTFLGVFPHSVRQSLFPVKELHAWECGR